MKLWERLQKKMQESPRARSIAQYLCFVVIAAVFWGFLTFNNDVKLDVEVPVKMTLPKNVHLLSKMPDTLTVTMNVRGYKFLTYMFKKTPTLNLRFTDYVDGTSYTCKIDQGHLKKAIAALFNKRANIISVLPESITIRYTDQPGKKVPIRPDIIVDPGEGFAKYGSLFLSQDSVYVYGDPTSLNEINEVYTSHIEEVGLTDTLRRSVGFAPISGAITEPRSIEVMVPIEKLTTRKQIVKIDVCNAPAGEKMLLFPSDVEVPYRSPVSRSSDEKDITIAVDYNEANTASTSNKLELIISKAPGVYEDMRLSHDSVEYVIEKPR
jgi:YbbR domain-containing protein